MPNDTWTPYGVSLPPPRVEDSGGPLTVKALVDATVQVADIYTADPSISANDLVPLADPKALILPQNVVPVVSKKVDAKAAAAIEQVVAKLGSGELRKLNSDSVAGQKKSGDVASAWLKAQGII